MDHQTTMSELAQPARDLRQHVAGMARDINRIAELQLQLLAADLDRARATMLRGAICWAAGLCVFAALLPVAVGGFGLWLSDVTRLTPAGGLLSASAAGAVIAVLLVLAGWVQFRKQRALWRTSIGELQKNFHAVREAMLNAVAPDSGPHSPCDLP
jgi:hypothetical protein